LKKSLEGSIEKLEHRFRPVLATFSIFSHLETIGAPHPVEAPGIDVAKNMNPDR